jgi:hypothetical protein
MAATGDWRPLERPERASLLERLIYVRTLSERLDLNRAQEFIDRGGRDRVADWRRLMLGAHATLTVEACNRYRGWGLLEEETELLAVWRLHRGSNLDPELWLEALGMDPAPSPVVAGQPQPVVRVLDLGMWMSFERRQVLSQLRWDVLCLGGLGLPEQERAVRKSSAHDYGGLETYPLVASEHDPEGRPEAASRTAAADLVRRRPDLVTAFMWVNLSQGTALGPASPALPPYALWFDPYSPFGTAFDAFNRAGRAQFRPLRRSDYATVPVAQAELAPYQYQLRWKLCQARGGRIVNPNPGLEVMEVVYAETAQYDAWALRALLSGAKKWSKPDAYRRYGTRLCDLLVDRCHELAAWLVEQEEDDAAAEIYRKWARGSRDRVEVSGEIEWLVNYEFDHGRRQEAFRLAREAAQVYSHSGLTLLASLFERTGDLTGAETYYRKAWDRYQGSLELGFFYHKHRSEPRLRAGIRRLERELFPNGLPRLAEPLPAEPPEDGVLITESSPRQLEAGLRIGQVIVGLDGYRARNLREYNWIRWLAEGDAPMTLTVWDGARYRVVKASPEDRTLGGSFDNYRPEGQ